MTATQALKEKILHRHQKATKRWQRQHLAPLHFLAKAMVIYILGQNAHQNKDVIEPVRKL